MSLKRFVLSVGLLSGFSALALADGYVLDQSNIRAQLSPVRHASLSAEIAAKVSFLAVREGQRVVKGETLVKFDCALQEAQFEKAKTQLGIARNVLKGHKRMAELNAIGTVELANSELDVRKARADVDYIQATLKRCVVKAPYAGVIGDQLTREQEFLQAGTPLMEIIDDSELQLEFIVPSRWLSWLSPKHEFSVNLSDTGKIYPAKLTYTAAKVDAISQTIKAVALIDGRFSELKPGMSGTVQLSPPSE
ncbi:efflux RND transporter periplasmic adaptor subunit [Neptuniibacter sp. QD37_6]|uniref:efflux RND transporter periplasmic adaptor subunit n=1 Tax=Neptuniibacter sp. QD37_6 TaxID=3398210 RepID=UPI0039F63B13